MRGGGTRGEAALVIGDTRVGGAQRVVCDLALGLRSLGWNASVVTLEDGPISHSLMAAGVEVRSFPQRFTLDPGLVLSMARWFRRKRVALVNTHMWLAHLYGSLAARLARVSAVVVTEHGRHILSAGRRRVGLRVLAALSDSVVTVSDDLRIGLKRHAGFRRGIQVVPNGVDTDLFSPSGAKRDFNRRELGVAPETVLIGMIGGARPVKGYDVLVRAVPGIVREVPHARFVLVGDGRGIHELQAEVRRLHIEDRFSFLGFRPDVSDLLTAMDLVVLPSRFEGMPISLLEAMAVERPVVATSVGGIPEVVTHGTEGLLVPPEDVEALSRAVVSLVLDPARRREMGLAGRRRVLRDYSRREMAERYDRLFSSLLALRGT